MTAVYSLGYTLLMSQTQNTPTVDWTKELAKIGIKPGVVYVGSKTMTPKQAVAHAKKYAGEDN